MRVWLNGSLIDEKKAAVSPFDRGFLFGDGVYEVIRFFNGVGVRPQDHVERLRCSLEHSRIAGFEADDAHEICRTLLDDFDVSDALVYLQVTRGNTGRRIHVPQDETPPTVFGFAMEAPGLADLPEPNEIRCVTRPDHRWRRCEIKSISLMGNVLSLLDAQEANAEEPILHQGGFVSEGARTTVFAVDSGRIITPPINAEPPILHGVTRAMAIEAAISRGLRVEERPLRLIELAGAQEIFVVSTSRLLSAVAELDRHPVGSQSTGPITRSIFSSMRETLATECSAAIHS